MLQDVKTRWNSTLYMLLRFLRLRDAITKWLDEDGAAAMGDFGMEEEEWTQIKYVAS